MTLQIITVSGTSFHWFKLRGIEGRRVWIVCLNDLDVSVSMFVNSSALPSSPTNTTTLSTPTEITPEFVENEQIFFQTAAARGVSGIFVWLSLIITCHQVRNYTRFALHRWMCFYLPSKRKCTSIKCERTCVRKLTFIQKSSVRAVLSSAHLYSWMP